MNFLKFLLGEREPRLSDEDLKRLAAHIAKQPLQFSDAEVKQIAHNIVDLDRDVDRLALRIVKTRRFYWPFLIVLFVTGVLGSLGAWKLVAYYVNHLQTRMQTKLDSSYQDVTNNIQLKLQSTYQEVTNNIGRMFQAKDISNILVSVASTETTNLLLRQIYPVLTTFEDTVSNSFVRIEEFNDSLTQSQTAQRNLQAVIDKANDAVSRLDQDSEFVTKSILAENDDRAPYEQLRKWAKEPSFGHQSSAGLVAARIGTRYYGLRGNYGLMPWELIADSTNRYSWNMDHINDIWGRLPAIQATD